MEITKQELLNQFKKGVIEYVFFNTKRNTFMGLSQEFKNVDIDNLKRMLKDDFIKEITTIIYKDLTAVNTVKLI